MDLKASDPSPAVRQSAAQALKKLAPSMTLSAGRVRPGGPPETRWSEHCSAPRDHDAELTEEEFRLLREFIHERFGLFFEESQRDSLRSRLAGRLSSLGLLSFEDYYRYLRFGPQRVEEEARMISHLTNNETYFFRESAQLQVFADVALRNVKERKTRERGRAPRLVRGMLHR